MVAYSVATKKKNIKDCEKIQKKCESGFCFPIKSLVGILSFLVIVLGVIYVAQVNRLATMGYEIKEKENLISELNKNNEALKIRAAELRSMHQLELEKEQMNLKKPKDVGYLELDDSVAMRR